MDAGGLAHMTCNNFSQNGGLSSPGSGYATRGKNSHIQRLSVAPHPQIGSIYEDRVDNTPTPRTSRSHLLAGLRTAPRTQLGPASAPFNVTQHRMALDAYGDRNITRYGQDVPQTSVGCRFPGNVQSLYSPTNGQQLYNSPDQILAPPAMPFEGDNEHMDPQLYNELLATNLYLAQRQQQLQQQLINVTAAAQQLRGMDLNPQQSAPSTPMSPQNGLYNQRLQNGLQPVIQAVPGQQGLYSVYNPMTGQHSYFVDRNAQVQQSGSSVHQTVYQSSSPESEYPQTYRLDTSSPTHAGLVGQTRIITPPKQSPSPPSDVTPLPPPSATAFRPGHKKASSSVTGGNGRSASGDAARATGSGYGNGLRTPQTGTFGPGMGRAGEHPVRQPRGPPPLEELIASPTSKHEGSKNFATRQRRRAVHNLVRARKERRSGRPDSADSASPTSDSDVNTPASSPESEYPTTEPSSASRSVVSLRAAANGAIGSERKEFRERSRDGMFFSCQDTSSSVDTDGTGLEDSVPDTLQHPDGIQNDADRRKMPMLVLTSAEKRKSSLN